MVLILAGALVLTGCSQGPPRERVTDTDRQRLQVMLDERIIRDSEQDLSKQPGTLLPGNGLKRGFVAGSVFSVHSDGQPVPPALTKRRTADAVGVLRSTGWTIASASCAPPQPGTPGNAWKWDSTAYKYIDGVGYWASLTAAAVESDLGVVDISLHAPNVDDPPDLVGHPDGLPAGSTCIEQPGLSKQAVEQGTPIQLKAVGSPKAGEPAP